MVSKKIFIRNKQMEKLTIQALKQHIKDMKMPIKMSSGGKALKKEELVKVVKALSPEEKAVEKAAVAVESGSVAKRSTKAKAVKSESMESKPMEKKEMGVVIVEAQKPVKAKKSVAKKESESVAKRSVKPVAKKADISRKITLTL